MGRKRKNAKQEGMDSSFDTSGLSSSSKPEISILAADFKQILDVVKENGNKLDNINNQLGTLTARVNNLEKEQSLQTNKINNTESKIGKIENETSSLKMQIKTCTDEIMELRRKNEDYMFRIVRMEAAKLENNVIIWNAACKDNNHAQVLFTEVVRHGLEMPEVNFTVTHYDSNRKFLKVTLNKKDDKFAILKNASKLKDKTFPGNNSNLFISDDVPTEIRKVRKLLLVKRDKLRKDHGCDAWISKGFQPNLLVKRPDGSITKYTFNDAIPEIDDFHKKFSIARREVPVIFPVDVQMS